MNIEDESEDPIISSYESNQRVFSSNGFTIERLVPYSKWRITFNGLCYTRKCDDQTEKNYDDDEPQHVIFTFL